MALALLLACAAAWLWWRSDFTDTPASTPAASAPSDTFHTSPDASANRGSALDGESKTKLLLPLAEEIKKTEAVRWSAQRIADNYRRAATAEERRLALAELRDWRFKRDDAAQVLRSALRDADIGVRVFAADLLYQMGLVDGKETLLEILRSVRSLAPHELTEAVNAAQILDRHREVIPPDLLVGLYEETNYPGVLYLMALQSDARYVPYVIASARKVPSESMTLLGHLGSPDGYELAKQIMERTQDARLKVAAAWALFRCGGDREAFAYVLDQAAAGLSPRVADGYDPYAVLSAMRLIGVTPDSSVLPVLHQAVTSNDSQTSGIALASLFYIQNDATFVDQFVRNYLSDPAMRKSSAVDPNLVWRIAASRNDPSLTALAYAANPERPRRLLIEGKDRPVLAVWIRQYLSDIPRR